MYCTLYTVQWTRKIQYCFSFEMKSCSITVCLCQRTMVLFSLFRFILLWFLFFFSISISSSFSHSILKSFLFVLFRFVCVSLHKKKKKTLINSSHIVGMFDTFQQEWQKKNKNGNERNSNHRQSAIDNANMDGDVD